MANFRPRYKITVTNVLEHSRAVPCTTFQLLFVFHRFQRYIHKEISQEGADSLIRIIDTPCESPYIVRCQPLSCDMMDTYGGILLAPVFRESKYTEFCSESLGKEVVELCKRFLVGDSDYKQETARLVYVTIDIKHVVKGRPNSDWLEKISSDDLARKIAKLENYLASYDGLTTAEEKMDEGCSMSCDVLETAVKKTKEEDCSICLEGFDNSRPVRLLQCSHVFHEDCVHVWFNKKTTCPVCRRQLPKAVF